MRSYSLPRATVLLCVLALFLPFLNVPAHAQTAGAGTISGTITDASHAAVSGATVTVTNTDTGAAHTFTTNDQGIYVAPFLQPGRYKVDAAAAGFGKVNATNLTLQVGQTLTIDLNLTVQSANTTVEVTSETPLLDTQRTEVSQVVDQQIIQNLPVNGRNWSDFVLLTPNVVPDGGSGLVSFHGISGLYNQNYVDGANNNQMLFSEARGRSSGAPFVYSLDAIKEFQAEAATYSAEFGQAAGGQVNAITKNGTNNLHGDLFYYLRYPSLNALDPIAKYTALNNPASPAAPFLLTQPTHQQQEFGGSVGGPIKKDKLFFFVTSDNFRRTGNALYYETNVVTQTPAGVFNDTATISPTQCPSTISSAQCKSAIDFLLSLQSAPKRYAKETLIFPRVDYQLNEKNLIYANFNWADFDQTYGYSPNPTFANSSASTNAPTSYHERFAIAHWTSTLSNTAVNDLRFQWGRDLETAGANAPGPSISMGAETYGMPNALPRTAEPDEHRYQITDVFDKVIGRHTVKFGGDVNLVHEIMINLFQGGGIYSYNCGNVTQNFQCWSADAFAGQAGDTDPFAGSHYSSFTQTIDQINPASKAGADDFWMKMYDGFAEDTWKVRQNLTLNLGVRYDFQLTPDPEMPNTSTVLAAKYNTKIKNVADRVEPRIGFSWSPYRDTIVRGGYGIFTGLNQGSTYYAMRVENGIYQINYSFKGCNATCNAGNAPALQFPNVPYQPTGPSIGGALHPDGGNAPAVTPLTVSGSGGFHGLSPDFVPPVTHEFTLGVEQALPGKLSLSIGYVGSRALHLPVFLDANLVGQTPHGVRSYNVTDTLGNTSQLTVPYYLATDRIDPTLTSLNTGFSVANTWYHSMAVTIRRPFDHGLEVLLNHTWSKALDDDQVQGAFGTFYGGNPVLDPNNLHNEYGRSDLDVRNRFVGTVLWKPEIMKDNPWMKHGLDAFTFSGTATESTGFPIVASMNTPGAVLSGTPGAADGNIYGGAISSGSGFATTGRPPQIQRNSLPGPGLRNIDFRVTRDIPIHEKIYLQFIGEAFNVLNHQIISGVATTYSTLNYAGKGGCPATASVPDGSQFAGCITPFTTNVPTSVFGAATSTSSVLYGPRQLQVSGKLFF
ncbi:MAG TPA: carboxypeptidase regulatory-like domain-containing protein [Terracidiphilus sp.]